MLVDHLQSLHKWTALNHTKRAHLCEYIVQKRTAIETHWWAFHTIKNGTVIVVLLICVIHTCLVLMCAFLYTYSMMELAPYAGLPCWHPGEWTLSWAHVCCYGHLLPATNWSPTCITSGTNTLILIKFWSLKSPSFLAGTLKGHPSRLGRNPGNQSCIRHTYMCTQGSGM
jgi:hypothetical protein